MKNKHIPERTCVGCREKKPKGELVRIVDTDDGLHVDRTGRMNGRGVYVCNEPGCLEAAIKNNGFKRSLKKNIAADEMQRLYEEIRSEKEVLQ